MKRSKGYIKSKTLVGDKSHMLVDAIDLIKQVAYVKFNESIDMALLLGIDPTKSDQSIRGACVLPHGNGKKVKVLVLAEAELATKAKGAGADFVGGKELVDEIKAGKSDFDVVISTPECMKYIAAVGNILGPRGLMPNPKLGTVTPDVENAVKEVKSGKATFRNDKGGVVHVALGKKDFPSEKIIENIKAVIAEIKKLKPVATKGEYMKKLYLSSTMGPSVNIDLSRM